MQALVLTRPGSDNPLDLQERPEPQPGPGEAVVRLYAAALNHRDWFHVRGLRSQGPAPFVPGSDGAGQVAAVGEGVTAWRAGDAVVINAALYCGQCSYCLRGEHSLCDTFGILGGPTDGTFAQYVKVPAGNLARKPAHLDFQQAAALPLALGTAWRAMVSRGALRPGESVLIHGIGGGVALYCLQIAASMGAQAIVTSGADWKLDRAKAMGASHGINYRHEDVAARCRELTGGDGVGLVIDSGGEQTLAVSLAAARKGGRVVNFGATTGAKAQFTVRDLYGKQVSLIGSTMNNQAEFDAAMRFVEQTGMKPNLSDLFPLAEAATAFAQMDTASQFGKLVLRID